MDPVNRSAAIIKPKQPFMEWLNALPDSDLVFTLAELQTYSSVLLIPEYDTDDQAHKFIKKIYKELFERELDSYCTDPNYWPSKLDYKTFLEWFDIDFHSEVFDTMEKEIDKEM